MAPRLSQCSARNVWNVFIVRAQHAFLALFKPSWQLSLVKKLHYWHGGPNLTPMMRSQNRPRSPRSEANEAIIVKTGSGSSGLIFIFFNTLNHMAVRLLCMTCRQRLTTRVANIRCRGHVILRPTISSSSDVWTSDGL